MMKCVSFRWVGMRLFVEHSRDKGDTSVARESSDLVVSRHGERDRCRCRWNGATKGEERATHSLAGDESLNAIDGIVVVGEGEGETSAGLRHLRGCHEELFA